MHEQPITIVDSKGPLLPVSMGLHCAIHLYLRAVYAVSDPAHQLEQSHLRHSARAARAFELSPALAV